MERVTGTTRERNRRPERPGLKSETWATHLKSGGCCFILVPDFLLGDACKTAYFFLSTALLFSSAVITLINLFTSADFSGARSSSRTTYSRE